MPTHLYLSPHFDDAVLSCGGLIHHQTQAGDRVRVLTLCAGRPTPGPLSAFAQTLHARWQVSAAQVVETRQTEDRAALAALGAEPLYLDLPDCIYRRHPQTNQALYASETALFGSVDAAETPLASALASQLGALLAQDASTQLYAPLGIGRHVDHQLTRQAAELLPGPRWYYEDYPYAARTPETADWAGLAKGLTRVYVDFFGADLEHYGRAVQAYSSQLSTFWPDAAAMWAALRAFCERSGAGALRQHLWRSAG